MGLKVDEEYYMNACEHYVQKMQQVENCLEEFKNTCNSLFSDNYYGDNIQRVLIARATEFYTSATTQLTSLISSTSEITENFLNEIESDDKL